MIPLVVSGNNLKVDDVVAVANGRPVTLDPAVLPRVERARAAVEAFVARGEVVYGITTGFGRFKDQIIDAAETRQLQQNLVRSHAVGVGPDLSEKIVRAMLLVRANTLALGYSGVRPEVIQLLLEMLNHGVHPRIPAQGSLGASGDLAPLAHLALVLIGEGQAHYQGELLDGRVALERASLSPLELRAKEGLALLNGTTQMVATGALLVRQAINLALTADVAACLSLEALNGTDRAYDARVHAVRPHPRQIDCAAFLRQLLAGSAFLRGAGSLNVQDPYTLRCVPQVHGAVRDAIAYARWVIDIELNAVNDNPIIFVDEETGQADVISAGNFHGEPVAIAMDYLKLALTELGNMSERRVARLVDADSNGGVLPMFLTEHGGLESGFMMVQYTAAALASENKVLAHPASADTIPSSANVEDHVSMGATAARQAGQITGHVETIVAIELLAAAQGADLRRRLTSQPAAPLGQGTAVAYGLIRQRVPFLEEDVFLAPYIEEVRQLVAAGTIKEAVEKELESND
ncbi:MAG: histidine ammonia-lyase [Chloroflexi bacterium]|nr:histidine ammonia-lyase [Chloroflexota bacterium]MCI0579095.1 histidine ammonia-lyase [Chloroflexota bacterium]MCI0650083.1 histidine ammonia-lyase [Chloroflexota bacterium]MCI0728291.1 histidine ammonia-lyase [Chloroflexota bacterium]